MDGFKFAKPNIVSLRVYAEGGTSYLKKRKEAAWIYYTDKNRDRMASPCDYTAAKEFISDLRGRYQRKE